MPERIPQNTAIIGLDLGGTKLLSILMKGEKNILTRKQAPTPRGNKAVTQATLDILDEILQEAHTQGIQPAGIAIGSPGFIDTPNGIIVDAENLEVIQLSLAKSVSERFQLPTRLFHDVKTAVLGEALYGGGIGFHNFAFLNIGTGISVGLYLDGRVYHGANNKSGEIGHMCLNPGGLTQAKSSESRLEALVSGPAMACRARSAYSRFPQSQIFSLTGENFDQITPHIIQKAALAGDTLALEIIADSADIIGAAIGALIDILDLECVILGGGVAQMGPLLLQPVQQAVAHYAIDPVPVLISPLGGNAGAIGVVASFFLEGG